MVGYGFRGAFVLGLILALAWWIGLLSLQGWLMYHKEEDCFSRHQGLWDGTYARLRWYVEASKSIFCCAVLCCD